MNQLQTQSAQVLIHDVLRLSERHDIDYVEFWLEDQIFDFSLRDQAEIKRLVRKYLPLFEA